MIRSRASSAVSTAKPSSSPGTNGAGGRMSSRKRQRMGFRRSIGISMSLLVFALVVLFVLAAAGWYCTLNYLPYAATTTKTLGQGDIRRTTTIQRNHFPIPKDRDKGDEDKTFGSGNLYNFETQSIRAPVCTPISEESIFTYTLVTQSSTSRLWMMKHHCELWPHLVSIAIAVDVDNNETTTNNKDWKQALVDMGCSAEKISVVVVPMTKSSSKSKKIHIKHNSEDTQHRNTADPTSEYPVNLLRNEALSQVRTSHAVYLDIDFWPSPDLYDLLNQESVRQHWIHNNNDNKMALVLPAFQIPRQCKQYTECRENNIRGMPKNREELIRGMKKHRVFQFDPTNRGGHGSTLYNEWKTQKSGEFLEIPCFLSNRYEPYLVFRYCKDVPPFQTAFTGYGKNKMTWIMHLRRLGWRFWQLPSYCTHYPHLDSPTRQLWNGGEKGELMHRPDDDAEFDFTAYSRGQNDLKFLEFKRWLYRTVPNQQAVPKCPKPKNSVGDDDAKLWVPRKSIRKYHQEYAKYGEEVEKLEAGEEDKRGGLSEDEDEDAAKEKEEGSEDEDTREDSIKEKPDEKEENASHGEKSVRENEEGEGVVKE